ncbi:MAG TPA: glycine zipper 2TM domain-containing protein [Caldimonas sp.]|nr:glycine zipper 2TM domain-containing protein [Caldimonas sp.]HEX4234629.1 glycine zipper 2TM domain-containing protein [Caldimonas sp.]
MSTETVPLFSRALSRAIAAVGAAAMVSALTLTACSPRDQSTAHAATAQTMPATTAAPGDTALAGTPVPPAPTAALAPAPAVAPPPPLPVAPAAPAPQGGYAAAPLPGPAANADDQVRSPPIAHDTRVAQNQAVPSGRLGSIESIEPIHERPKGTGAGAVIGGVAGAVIGNQFGSGLGRAAMTGLGAAGGAVAGNNVERNIKTRVVGYRIHVRLDDGHTRVFERGQLGNLHVGDRLRVEGGSFHRV